MTDSRVLVLGDAPAELILVELKAGGAHPVKKK
jgi:hypothetical protein